MRLYFSKLDYRTVCAGVLFSLLLQSSSALVLAQEVDVEPQGEISNSEEVISGENVIAEEVLSGEEELDSEMEKQEIQEDEIPEEMSLLNEEEATTDYAKTIFEPK
jgi:hypothetical protein